MRPRALDKLQVTWSADVRECEKHSQVSGGLNSVREKPQRQSYIKQKRSNSDEIDPIQSKPEYRRSTGIELC